MTISLYLALSVSVLFASLLQLINNLLTAASSRVPFYVIRPLTSMNASL